MKLVIGRPSGTQEQFLMDRHKHVAFGGARGGGKSWSVRAKATLMALRYPGIKIMIMRRSYPELINNHVNEMRRTLYGAARFNETRMTFTFPNGSMIRFGYCNADKDVMRYQGLEVDVLMLDEATQFKEEWIRSLTACVRGANDNPKRIYYTCNPGGVSHGYIKRLFIDRRFQQGEIAEEYSFIQSKVTDNLALMEKDPDYIHQLEALPYKLRRAWLDGDWNIFEGQFFEEFADDPRHYEDRRYTHVIEPFEIPREWPVYRSFDWGYSKPFSCAWWAVDYDGRLYRILELYGCARDAGTGVDMPNEGVKWDAGRVFEEIARVEREHRWLAGKKVIGVADPAIWASDGGPSIADTAAKAGVYFNPGDHQRIPGWMQVHYRLTFDEEGLPMMYIFKTCRAFIRTMPILQYDAHRVEDLDTEGEDHVADEVRYMCMARPMKPVKTRAAERKPFNPLEDEDDRRYGAYGAYARI